MTDLPECVCPTPENALRAAMEGKAVPRCQMHGTFGYEPPEPTPADSMALNSDALESALLNRIGGTAATSDDFTNL
ncbi:hypothetical protein [Nocardioides sp. Kera G14]|uniref:hypothetical protein n=1 Tax=Nocardioides sp. Kera G14 TaxID=2884264 RepID=UPI001D10FCE4|nr:hypothetical protein [Nocardioides sp. Kera G14]UDY22396.1 hypothetical protein LH076_09920 [Nocardioides sp. Kera G14]